MSSIPAMMRSLSSCFDPTLMWRRTERANMEKKPSMKVEPGAVLGCEGELETAGRSSGQPSFGFSRGVRGMIVENQFDGGAARISGVNKFEEFDELSTAVAVSVQAVDLPREQINPGQQADSAVAFVLMIAREGRVNAGLGRQIGCCRCDGLDSRLFIVRDDRHRLVCFLRLGPFQNLDLAVNAQNFCHLLLELGVAPFQIVPIGQRMCLPASLEPRTDRCGAFSGIGRRSGCHKLRTNSRTRWCGFRDAASPRER